MALEVRKGAKWVLNKMKGRMEKGFEGGSYRGKRVKGGLRC